MNCCQAPVPPVLVPESIPKENICVSSINSTKEINVGDVLSIVKVILVAPAYASPERSVPETVAVTIPLVVVDTVQG